MIGYQKKLFKLIFLSFVPLCVLILAGCEKEETPEKPKLNHKNAVEYYVTSTRENNVLVVTTKKDIYSNYKLLSSTITHDTLPDIGTEMVTTEDESGNEVKKTEPLAYDIFFHSERK